MKSAQDPQDPIEILFSQINGAFKYSVFVQQPIPDATLVQSAKVLIIQAGFC